MMIEKFWPIILAAIMLGSPLSAEPAAPAKSANFDRSSQRCLAGDANECLGALISYAREISNDDLGPVIALLKSQCTAEVVTGCAALANAYGSIENISIEGRTRVGINDPVLRRSALETGCARIMISYNTCGELAQDRISEGDNAGASAAFEQACAYFRETPEAERTYTNDWDCYNSAKHALQTTHDYAGAQRDFQLICSGDLAGLSPYGCKYLGRIFEKGLGVTANPDRARQFYAQSCFHQTVEDSDGEGCLLYGNRLIADRDRVAQQGHERGESAYTSLQEASRAFQRGCATRIPLACEANDKLLARELSGEFGFAKVPCFLRNPGQRTHAARKCGLVRHHLNLAGEEAEDTAPFENIYIWPDGERTVLRFVEGVWLINGKPTSGTHYEGEDEYFCVTNEPATREFCAGEMLF